MKNMASIGFSKYSITEEGRIYSHKSNRFLNPYKSIDKAGGYFVHSLWNDDTKQKIVKLHRLVAIMYIPNPEKILEATTVRNALVAFSDWLDMNPDCWENNGYDYNSLGRKAQKIYDDILYDNVYANTKEALN